MALRTLDVTAQTHRFLRKAPGVTVKEAPATGQALLVAWLALCLTAGGAQGSALSWPSAPPWTASAPSFQPFSGSLARPGPAPVLCGAGEGLHAGLWAATLLHWSLKAQALGRGKAGSCVLQRRRWAFLHSPLGAAWGSSWRPQ